MKINKKGKFRVCLLSLVIHQIKCVFLRQDFQTSQFWTHLLQCTSQHDPGVLISLQILVFILDDWNERWTTAVHIEINSRKRQILRKWISDAIKHFAWSEVISSKKHIMWQLGSLHHLLCSAEPLVQALIANVRTFLTQRL